MQYTHKQRGTIIKEAVRAELLLLHIKRRDLRWFTRWHQDASWASLRLFWSCAAKGSSWGTPSTRWRNYISHLAVEHHGVPYEELEEVAEERMVWVLCYQTWINVRKWRTEWNRSVAGEAHKSNELLNMMCQSCFGWSFGVWLWCSAVTREGRETTVSSRCYNVMIPHWCYNSTHILDVSTAGKLAYQSVGQQNISVAFHKRPVEVF